MKVGSIFNFLDHIDRRIIYLFVLIALALPIIYGGSLRPAEMKSAELFFKAIEDLKYKAGDFVLIASDWGPNTLAENQPQTQIAIEHLMRKRIPFALITNLAYATPFLEKLPREIAKSLSEEYPSQKWMYGRDWVNLGYRPGALTMIEGIAKSKNLTELWQTDAFGTPLDQLPFFSNSTSTNAVTIRNIPMLMEFTGLTNVFNYWLQFFFVEGHSPLYLHGCTSITIPEAKNYLAAKQIVGLHEGVAGAAWHEYLLAGRFPGRKMQFALPINTGLSYAHLVIIGLIILGNLGMFLGWLTQRKD